MAARVGTGVTGSASGSASSIASAGKNTTTGNLLVAFIKWETTGRSCTGLTDTAGNTWTIIAENAYTSGEPDGCLAYAANITGNASNVVTASFSAGCTFRRIIVEEFSGLATSSVLDGTYQTDTGTDGQYVTANITTSTTGLVVLGVGEYNAFSTYNGTPGNPDFTIGTVVSDTMFAYLISSSAQTVTPGAQETSAFAQHTAIAQAFKDAGAGGTSITPSAGTLTLTGRAPSLGLGITPSAGTLTLTGRAPSLSLGISTGAGQLTLTGFAPTLSITTNVSVTPSVGTLTLTGVAPTVAATANQFASPGVGTLTLTGFAPTVSIGEQGNITPSTGTLTLTGFAPSLGLGITPSAGALTLTGFAPSLSVTANQFATPGVGTLTLTGVAPTVSVTANQFATPGVGTLTVTGFAPTVDASASRDITPGVGVLTLTGYAPDVRNSSDRRTQDAGKRKRDRKRKYTVEVEGVEYSVESPDEAAAVLAKAREIAEERVEVVLERSRKATRRPVRKVLADARKALQPPTISAPDELGSDVSAVLAEIQALYESAMRTVEIGALMRRAEEDDDEEAILLLMA